MCIFIPEIFHRNIVERHFSAVCLEKTGIFDQIFRESYKLQETHDFLERKIQRIREQYWSNMLNWVQHQCNPTVFFLVCRIKSEPCPKGEPRKLELTPVGCSIPGCRAPFRLHANKVREAFCF